MTEFVFPLANIPRIEDAPAIRWGVIAPGGIAHAFVSDVQKFTASSVVAVGSRSYERAEQFAQQYAISRAFGSYEELVQCSEVDAVYIASPHSEHHAHALLALDAGKAILVEKSFTKTADETRDVIATARANNLLAMEAMWTRFLPHISVIRQIASSGVLGRIVNVSADHGQLMTQGPEHRLFNKNLAGGALLDLGVYPVSFVSMILGAPVRITASGTLTDTGVDAQISAVFDYNDGAQALINTTLLAKTPTAAVINGTRGRIEIHGDFYAPTSFDVIFADNSRYTWQNTFVSRESGYAFQAAHFAALLHEGKTESPLISLNETLSIMETMDEMRTQVGYHF